MIVEFNIRWERFYALIVILGFITTNIFLYFDNPSSIIEFLSIQLLYVLFGGLYEGAILWMAAKFEQGKMSSLEGYSLIIVIILGQVILAFFFGDLSQLITALLGIWLMTTTLFLGIVIVRQMYIARYSEEIKRLSSSDSNNM